MRVSLDLTSTLQGIARIKGALQAAGDVLARPVAQQLGVDKYDLQQYVPPQVRAKVGRHMWGQRAWTIGRSKDSLAAKGAAHLLHDRAFVERGGVAVLLQNLDLAAYAMDLGHRVVEEGSVDGLLGYNIHLQIARMLETPGGYAQFSRVIDSFRETMSFTEFFSMFYPFFHIQANQPGKSSFDRSKMECLGRAVVKAMVDEPDEDQFKITFAANFFVRSEKGVWQLNTKAANVVDVLDKASAKSFGIYCYKKLAVMNQNLITKMIASAELREALGEELIYGDLYIQWTLLQDAEQTS